MQADLPDASRLPGLIETTVTRFGRLDALINNASMFHPTPVGSITAEQCGALFAANARAPLLLAQAAAPHLETSQGCIVNITDLYVERPLPQHTAYCMSKMALCMASMVLAHDIAPAVHVTPSHRVRSCGHTAKVTPIANRSSREFPWHVPGRRKKLPARCFG